MVDDSRFEEKDLILRDPSPIAHRNKGDIYHGALVHGLRLTRLLASVVVEIWSVGIVFGVKYPRAHIIIGACPQAHPF